MSRAFIKADFETCVSQTLTLLNDYFAVESHFSGKALDRQALNLKPRVKSLRSFYTGLYPQKISNPKLQTL